MTNAKLMVAGALLATSAVPAGAQPGASEDLRPPGSVEVIPVPVDVAPPVTVVHQKRSPLATTERWGGGVRLTGLSGIGALPGVNYGGEVSAMVRRDELFAELGFGWWKPQKTYLVAESPDRIELGLDVWTLRAGWASMTMPLRLWGLVEVGELASARGMPGVVTRMMTGDVPQERQWHALGAGFGVAWPMTDNVRLFGMLEVAVPIDRQQLMLEVGGGYQPDPLAARSSAGLELGWR